MQIERNRCNGNHQFLSDRTVDTVYGARENNLTMSSNFRLVSPSSSSSPNLTSGGGVNFIEHHVSKMDTLAGVAIKYGVEVADIKRMNGLVTDLQMFALKTLQIPLPGRHPPSASLSNGSSTPGESNVDQTPSRRTHTNVLESLQSLGLKSPQWKVSPAMSSLQGYYGLKPPNHKRTEEGTEMAVYRTSQAHYLEDGPIPKPSLSDPPPNRHRKSRSLVNGILPENGETAEDVPFAEAGDGKAEKSNEKPVRRRQKADTDLGSCTPEMLLKMDNSGGSGFSAVAGKGLALRPKSSSRTSLPVDTDSGWLNPIPVGLGDSIMTNGFEGVRKSSSTSNLQDQQDSNGSSSIWPTSKWSLKQDFQALSAAAITKPIFDGLPKPMTGRRNKAALD